MNGPDRDGRGAPRADLLPPAKVPLLLLLPHTLLEKHGDNRGPDRRARMVLPAAAVAWLWLVVTNLALLGVKPRLRLKAVATAVDAARTDTACLILTTRERERER